MTIERDERRRFVVSMTLIGGSIWAVLNVVTLFELVEPKVYPGFAYLCLLAVAVTYVISYGTWRVGWKVFFGEQILGRRNKNS